MEQNQLLLLKINVIKEKTGTWQKQKKRETRMVEKAGTRNIADRENKIEILLKEGHKRKVCFVWLYFISSGSGHWTFVPRKEINMTNRRWSKSHREKR